MISIRQIQILGGVLITLLSLGAVQADVGTVRLREAQGPFVVTLFTCSEVVKGTASDVSVMVQRRDSSEPVLDARVKLVLTAPRDSVLEDTDPFCRAPEEMFLSGMPGAQGRQVILSATRDRSSNKLLYAVPVNWPLPGRWNLEALVRHGPDSAQVMCDVAVGMPTDQVKRLLPYLVLPPLLVAVFAMNQWLRRSSFYTTK
jgi:hypothetical protein